MKSQSVTNLIGFSKMGGSVMDMTKSFSNKVDYRFNDWDDVNSYRGMHNNDAGPG